MSKCLICVEQDREDPTYHPGQPITGKVRVEVDAECRCKDLKLSLCWRTHGSGDEQDDEVEEVSLFKGTWQTGTSQAYAFNLVAPDSPCSYHGHYLNVDWHLKATADIPWAADPEAEAELLIVPAQPDLQVGFQFEELANMSRRTSIVIELLVALFVGVPLIGGGLYCGIPGAREGEIGEIAVGLVFLIVGLVVLWGLLSSRIAEARIGAVDYEVIPPGPQAEPIRCVVRPRRKLAKSVRCSASLRVYEEVVEGSGSDSETMTKTLYKQRQTLRPRAGHPQELTGQIELPDGPYYSFDEWHNKLIWKLELELEVPGWPDWGESVTLWATPVGSPSTAVGGSGPEPA